ncbi:MAG: hypothetical protein AAF990_20765 [Bacteroidota bacterium]
MTYKSNNNNCQAGTNKRLNTFQAIVADYKNRVRQHSAGILRFYQNLPDLHTAIDNASYAKIENGKRHDHQRRIGGLAMDETKRRLTIIEYEISQCKSFLELFDLINQHIFPISGIGELMVYDTVLRIGAHLQLKPAHVYLHRGARTGADALELGSGQRMIPLSELPPAFHELEPYEVEDCLCIYKDDLYRIHHSV